MASAAAASSSMDASNEDGFDLYESMDITSQLPSSVELESSLEEAVAHRTRLQAELDSLQAQFKGGKQRVEDLTRRVCILLQTAQLEIQRKDAELQALVRTHPQHDRRANTSLEHQHRRPRSPDRRPRRSRSRSRSPRREQRRREDDEGARGLEAARRR